jgi:uncharacterized protein (TIGR02246 family)
MKVTQPVFIVIRRLIAVAALLLVGSTPFAQDTKSATQLTGQDRALIQDLIHQYSYAYDAQDAEAFLDLFTADCLFEAYANEGAKVVFKLTGREQVAKAIATRFAAYRQSGVQTRHFATNTILSRVADGKVEATSMFVLMLQPPKTDAPQPSEMGYYKDTIVKTDKGWRFAKRTALLAHK